jgi:hypothetical protein
MTSLTTGAPRACGTFARAVEESLLAEGVAGFLGLNRTDDAFPCRTDDPRKDTRGAVTGATLRNTELQYFTPQIATFSCNDGDGSLWRTTGPHGHNARRLAAFLGEDR